MFFFSPLLPVPSYAWSSYLALKTIPARGSNSLRFTWYKKCYGVGRDGGGVGCHCKHLNKFLSFLREALTYAEVHPLYLQRLTPIYILLKKKEKKRKYVTRCFYAQSTTTTVISRWRKKEQKERGLSTVCEIFSRYQIPSLTATVAQKSWQQQTSKAKAQLLSLSK